MRPPIPSGLARPLLCAAVLAAALAHIEASVVVYLRETLVPVRTRYFPDAVREPLPLLDLDQLREAGPAVRSFLGFEMARELSALAVLAAAAIGLSRRRRQGVWLFLLAFGLWDILYYVFLKLLMDWPASPGTWDVLFLVPVPWVAPVWAPLAVAVVLLLGGLAGLTRPRRRLTGAGRAAAGVVFALAVALVLASFIRRWPQAVGGVPPAFDWPLFLAGWALGAGGLAWVLSRRSARGP